MSELQRASLGRALWALLRRDLLLAYRRLSEVGNPLVFALIVIALFPLGIGPTASLLAAVAPGLVWVVALLACLLSSDSLFRDDYVDGTLEQMLLLPHSGYFLALGKVAGHWLVAGLPLVLISPLLAVMLALPAGGVWPLFVSLLLGTGTLSFIGAIGAALTVSLRRGGLLISLIVLPLYIPVLVFGAAAVDAAANGLPWGSHVAVLGALLCLALVLSPLAIAGGLRLNSQ